MNADYAEFNSSRLAEIYDSFCPLGTDSDFFLNEVRKVKPRAVLDVGCGSGILTVELAKIADKVIGVEPALPMLEVARRRAEGNKVTWVQGYAKDITGVTVDVIIMTSHVAQFMLDEDEWQSTLKHLNSLLKPGGKIIFDSKNPLAKPWSSWNKENTIRSADTAHGKVMMWTELLSVVGSRVQYQLYYMFDSGEVLVSNNELVYRTKEILIDSLNEAGFEVEEIYGDWDGSVADDFSEEMIFVARKS
jgi:SAM-dependent methyltransferase